MNNTERENLFATCASDLRPMLWRLAGGFASRSSQEDLLQEIFVQIWISLPRFEAKSKLSTWAYRVALNTAFNWSRKQRTARKNEDLAAQELPTTFTPKAERSETLELLYFALQQLEELDRSILLLALEETPRSEIAQILGVSENAANVRLHRARQRLNELLKQEIR